jgi:hypothetical protein
MAHMCRNTSPYTATQSAGYSVVYTKDAISTIIDCTGLFCNDIP